MSLTTDFKQWIDDYVGDFDYALDLYDALNSFFSSEDEDFHFLDPNAKPSFETTFYKLSGDVPPKSKGIFVRIKNDPTGPVLKIVSTKALNLLVKLLNENFNGGFGSIDGYKYFQDAMEKDD